jgi:hypothetical protein
MILLSSKKKKSGKSVRKNKSRKNKNKSGKNKSRKNKSRKNKSRKKNIKLDGMFDERIPDETLTGTSAAIKMNGILIKDTLISRISGPASITILKPTKDFHKSHKAPIFILFGDVHESKDNMCLECKCESKSEFCCYEIYSPEFLKLIDGIAEHHTVYLNIENTLPGDYLRPKRRYETKSEESLSETPLVQMISRYEPCYSRLLKNTRPDDYFSLCPTRHVIWQSSDIRRRTLGSRNNLSICLNSFKEMIILEQGGIHGHPEFLGKKILNVLDEDYVMEFRDKFSIYLPCIRDFFNPEFYKKIFTFKSHNNKYDDNYFPVITLDSPVSKQIEKMDPDKQVEWYNYIDQYYNYHNNNLRYYEEDIDKYFKSIIDSIINKDFKTTVSLIKSDDTQLWLARNIIFEQLLSFNSKSLDLYFLARSFKTTIDNKNPIVSIGYFGQDHTENIEYFLTKIMKNYEVEYHYSSKKEDKVVNRCMEINKHIDLNKMIMDLTS